MPFKLRRHATGQHDWLVVSRQSRVELAVRFCSIKKCCIKTGIAESMLAFPAVSVLHIGVAKCFVTAGRVQIATLYLVALMLSIQAGVKDDAMFIYVARQMMQLLGYMTITAAHDSEVFGTRRVKTDLDKCSFWSM